MVVSPMPEILLNSAAFLILPTLLRYSTIALAFASPIPLNFCNVAASALLILIFAAAKNTSGQIGTPAARSTTELVKIIKKLTALI